MYVALGAITSHVAQMQAAMDIDPAWLQTTVIALSPSYITHK